MASSTISVYIVTCYCIKAHPCHTFSSWNIHDLLTLSMLPTYIMQIFTCADKNCILAWKSMVVILLSFHWLMIISVQPSTRGCYSYSKSQFSHLFQSFLTGKYPFSIDKIQCCPFSLVNDHDVSISHYQKLSFKNENGPFSTLKISISSLLQHRYFILIYM